MTQPRFDQERLPALLTLLQTTHAEISRYRDYEWKVTAWCLVMIIATISVPGIGHGGRISPECRTCWRILLGAFTVATAVWAVVYVGVLHSRLTSNKVRRRKMEVMLEFYEQNAYATETLEAPWDSAIVQPYCMLQRANPIQVRHDIDGFRFLPPSATTEV